MTQNNAGTQTYKCSTVRLMRHVCAMGHLEEVAQDEYKLTNFTKSLSLDVIGDGYVAL